MNNISYMLKVRRCRGGGISDQLSAPFASSTYTWWRRSEIFLKNGLIIYFCHMLLSNNSCYASCQNNDHDILKQRKKHFFTCTLYSNVPFSMYSYMMPDIQILGIKVFWEMLSVLLRCILVAAQHRGQLILSSNIANFAQLILRGPQGCHQNI